MASSNSSSTSSKTKKNAQDALDRFKMEVALPLFPFRTDNW